LESTSGQKPVEPVSAAAAAAAIPKYRKKLPRKRTFFHQSEKMIN
jgi:hypothetical protein